MRTRSGRAATLDGATIAEYLRARLAAPREFPEEAERARTAA